MEDIKVEKIRLEDGRYAERHVKETDDERVIELHCEPERPLCLTQRVVERKKPIIWERTVEMVQNGEVVERRVESLEPNVTRELREHIARAPVRCEEPLEVLDPKAVITREELRDALMAVIKAIRSTDLAASSAPAPKAKYRSNMMQEVADRVQDSTKPSWKSIGLWALVAVEALGLTYVLVWM